MVDNLPMAFAINIEFYTKSTPRPEFILEPYWWNYQELKQTYPFTKIENQPDFLQYAYIISKEQLALITKQQFKNLESDERFARGMLITGQVKQAITSGTVFEKIQIIIFEWNSGD